jgi:cytochrome c oxidase accessory protein FixG
MEDLYGHEEFRDRVSTVTASGKRNWIYALQPKGRYYQYRIILSYACLAVFLALPWIKVNGSPLFLINIIESKFIVFGKIFWPQDFFMLALAMITMIVFVALFTVIYGRLFCGWACPQTIFMEFIFRRIEWWIEGSPSQQRQLKEAPWSAVKLRKKMLKHGLFLLISFLIAHTFLAYILGIDEVLRLLREPVSLHIGLLAAMLVFTGLFYGVFAFVREIVCTTVCPYGRLQGVLYDKDTMQIAYDHVRGEPRGRFKKTETRTLGDCVDCKKCVLVCPTGIDIRDGVQMDCVGCTACIDACDEVMDKVGLPRGLIRYASENQISQKTGFHFTARMKAYSGLLLLLMVAMSFMVSTRQHVDTYISRVKGQLYQEVSADTISNLFEIKWINKSQKETQVDLRLEDMPGTIQWIGQMDFILKPETIHDHTFFMKIPKQAIHHRKNAVTIGIYEEGKRIQRIRTQFLGPFQ